MSRLDHFPDGTLLKRRHDLTDFQSRWSSVFLVLLYKGEVLESEVLGTDAHSEKYYDVYEIWDLKRQWRRSLFVDPIKDSWEAFYPEGVVLTNNSRCVMLP